MSIPKTTSYLTMNDALSHNGSIGNYTMHTNDDVTHKMMLVNENNSLKKSLEDVLALND